MQQVAKRKQANYLFRLLRVAFKVMQPMMIMMMRGMNEMLCCMWCKTEQANALGLVCFYRASWRLPEVAKWSLLKRMREPIRK